MPHVNYHVCEENAIIIPNKEETQLGFIQIDNRLMIRLCLL